MRTGSRRIAKALWIGVLCGGVWTTAPVSFAQGVRDIRIDLHPLGKQVGIISRVVSNSAWITLPEPTRMGANVEFLLFSDGGDVMAVGKIKWVAPVAPYEAYITDIRASSTRHPANDFDSLFADEALARRSARVRPRPLNDANGVSLAAGLFARAPILSWELRQDKEDIEPVRAHIQALRLLSNKQARALAEAAAKCLPASASPENADTLAGDEVDYAALSAILQRFRRLRLSDPITEKLLRRMIHLVAENSVPGELIPDDFLRPPSQQGGGPGGI